MVIRIQTLLSRLTPVLPNHEDDIIEIGKYTIDGKNQKLIYEDNFITMTTRETELLKMLAANKNSLSTHKDILTTLWGDNDYFNRKSLNVFITRLRNYLKADEQVSIENVHGKGFILRVSE